MRPCSPARQGWGCTCSRAFRGQAHEVALPLSHLPGQHFSRAVGLAQSSLQGGRDGGIGTPRRL